MRSGRVWAIVRIFVVAGVAWFILGNTVVQRTQAGYQQLTPQVEGLAGGPLLQHAPRVTMTHGAAEEVIPLEQSDLAVQMQLEYRQKGLLWYSTYHVDFAGTYAFRNPSNETRAFTAVMSFPSDSADMQYDDFTVLCNDVPAEATASGSAARVTLPPGQSATLTCHYRTMGLNTWQYAFGDGVKRVKNFTLTTTTDFPNYDFPAGTISPTTKKRRAARPR